MKNLKRFSALFALFIIGLFQQPMANADEIYCKNRPSLNDGKCEESTSGGIVTIKCTPTDTTAEQDCYGLGGSS
jgi:hypothetical protein